MIREGVHAGFLLPWNDMTKKDLGLWKNLSQSLATRADGIKIPFLNWRMVEATGVEIYGVRIKYFSLEDIGISSKWKYTKNSILIDTTGSKMYNNQAVIKILNS